MLRKSLYETLPGRQEDESRLRFSVPIGGFHKENRCTWQEPSSSEDDDELFNVENCWESLLNLPCCIHVMVKEKYQKALDMQVGVNVSQEFPWKQLKFSQIREHLIGNVENTDDLENAFQTYAPDHLVLIGYAPILTQNNEHQPEDDPFILFAGAEDTRTALNIIKNIELYERWKINKRIVKKPKRWVSLKSEREVNLTLQRRPVDDVKIEIQSAYPIPITPKPLDLKFRKTDDVRDGYIELLPAENEKFDNIIKRRVTIGIQSVARRIDLEQQTDLTFPKNAWAQYLYEVDENELGLDESSEEEDKDKDKPSQTAKPVPPQPKEPPELSDHIKFLLKTLDFNQIDMYRNDYPLISEKQIKHYTSPYLEESLCYVNISKSYGRYVSGTDWYPSISGLIVTSYTHDTKATIEKVTDRVDAVQRAVLQPNPILMWSFSDNLNYKLEFESPFEVTVLSFCPFWPQQLFGGTKNGLLIIWDLQSRADKLDVEEIRTAAQVNYQALMGDYLKWTIPINEDSTVPPAYITSLEHSQKAAITGIFWIGQQYFVNTFGKVYTDKDNPHHKCFVTSSIDGTIVFWNLDNIVTKMAQGNRSNKSQPKELTQSESRYKDKILKPVYTLVYNEPITSIMADTTVFRCRVKEPLKNRKNLLNYSTELVPNNPPTMRSSLIISSFYGRLERLDWMGLYTDAEGRELITNTTSFARVHDGPVLTMKRNPFYPMIFASIGRNVFALWKEDYNYSPIFWRKRPCDLTAVTWSENRPGVLFITRIDGCLEAWDILARDDDACLSDILGGGVVTAISEHRPSEPEKLLGIGDYNSSFRMIKLPQSFYIPVRNELEHLQEYIQKQETRKKSMQAWEQQYYEKNRDVIEAKRQAENDARKEMERIEKEGALNAARKAQEDLEASRRANQPQPTSYTEKMKQKWDELNLNRLLTILMSRKRVDAQQLEEDTALEKKRLSYEAAKKAALTQTLQSSADIVAAVRSRILPVEKPDLRRHDMVKAIVDRVIAKSSTFEDIDREANEILLGFESFRDIDYIEFLERGEHRRKNLNKTLGGNTERCFWFSQLKKAGALKDCNWGYESFMNANLDLEKRSLELRLSDDISIQYSDEDDGEENYEE